MMRMFGKRQVTEWTLKLGSMANVTDRSSGKEVILQFQTPQIANNKTFYTDSAKFRATTSFSLKYWMRWPRRSCQHLPQRVNGNGVSERMQHI
jgi:hypothetical protein